eukprot:1185983-Prorocentrum_minimum.AAC.3
MDEDAPFATWCALCGRRLRARLGRSPDRDPNAHIDPLVRVRPESRAIPPGVRNYASREASHLEMDLHPHIYGLGESRGCSDQDAILSRTARGGERT